MNSRIDHRSGLCVLGLLLAAAWAAACTKPNAVSCSSGVYCPAGSQCSGNGRECITTPCGNGREEPELGEACDDGGTDPFDQLPTGERCSEDCTSNQECGNGQTDSEVGEICDPQDPRYIDPETHVSLCDASCSRIAGTCGDGNINQGGDTPEQCDFGPEGNRDSGDCTAGCQWNVCGDGRRNETNVSPIGTTPVPREDCDGGQSSAVPASPFFCEYGRTQPRPWDERDRRCSQCHWAYCEPHYCGDGRIETAHGESCDPPDGGTSCAYGQATCTICSSSCRTVRSTGNYCGDGRVTYVDGGEGCDAVESFACRTCGGPDEATEDQRCVWLGRGRATGTLTVASAHVVGEWFELKDSVNDATGVRFRFVGSASSTATDITVTDGMTRDRIANAIRDAVNRHPGGLRIDASRPYGDVVRLDNQDEGIQGNVRIQVSDRDELEPVGMTDGRGCSAGQPCAADGDCLSHDCGDDGFCN